MTESFFVSLFHYFNRDTKQGFGPNIVFFVPLNRWIETTPVLFLLIRKVVSFFVVVYEITCFTRVNPPKRK